MATYLKRNFAAKKASKKGYILKLTATKKQCNYNETTMKLQIWMNAVCDAKIALRLTLCEGAMNMQTFLASPAKDSPHPCGKTHTSGIEATT